MTALDVAVGYGLPLQQKGSKYWACCPLHGEKTPSLCFFPDGRWYCFGCHQYGDAADLHAALYGVPLAEALRIVKGDSPSYSPAQNRRQTAAQLRRKVEAWKNNRWAEACRQKHHAQQVIEQLEAQYSSEILMNRDDFWEAVDQKATAEDSLNLLECASPAQLVRMAAEDRKNEEL